MTTSDRGRPVSPSGPPQSIRVAVLDDHVVVRYAIELLVNQTPGLAWTGAAACPMTLWHLLSQGPCQVLILDYQLADDEVDGWSLVRHVRARFPQVRILVYTAFASCVVARIMRRAGVHGFLGKDAGLDALISAIRLIAAGEKVFAEPASTGCQPAGPHSDRIELSPRENEVLRCCLHGMSVTSIAQKFRRSVKTISAQKLAGYRKLGVQSDHDFLLFYADARPNAGWSRE